MRPKGPVDTAAEPAAQPTAVTAWSSKLQQRHFERTAVVYVRQSTAHQVLNHRESAARQYALVTWLFSSAGRPIASKSSTRTKAGAERRSKVATASSDCSPK